MNPLLEGAVKQQNALSGQVWEAPEVSELGLEFYVILWQIKW